MKLIRRIHQIEITSRCNLRCKYCVHPHMPRVKQDMTQDIFLRALNVANQYVAAGTQTELNLCGIGESTMHPEFIDFVWLARKMLPTVDLTMATNGVGLTEQMAQAMSDADMRVWVSLHRPEKAGLAVELLKKHGVLAGISSDPSLAAVDWAGQVDWFVSAPKMKCMWLNTAAAIVFSDGRLGTCCFDGQGTDGIIGHIDGDPATWFSKPYSLCKTCHMKE